MPPVPPSSPLAALLGPLADLMPFPSFNKIQSEVGPCLLTTDDNVIVSAPTGSGKTLLLEFAIIRLFQNELLQGGLGGGGEAPNGLDGDDDDDDDQRGRKKKKKAVYICPIKALAYEKFTAWSAKFLPTLQVVIETGDQGVEEESSLEKISGAHIIITTPERWDSITRRWKEGAALAIVAVVDLLLIDEVHIVGEARGAVLEALVSRMKAVKAATPGSKLRFVGISGTIPNIQDFARWLNVPPGCVFHFSSKDRPVKLRVLVQSFVSNSRNPFGFEKFLNYKMIPIVQQYSEGKPCLIFCPSRKESVTTATHVAEELTAMALQAGVSMGNIETEEAAERASDKQLRRCLHSGVGFHHAALSLEDRRLVETLFISQFLSVLCTTTTLAMGVNLPARLVIVKGTTFFRNGLRDDLPATDVAQMIGRAGRPGFDTEGTAVIVTSDDKAHLYDKFRNGGDAATVVESQLHQNMVEHVNAEIALKTISSVATAVDWLKTTFLWVRLESSPASYGLKSFEAPATADGAPPAGMAVSSASAASALLHQFAKRLVSQIISDLHKEHCVELLAAPAAVNKTTSTSGSGAMVASDLPLASTRIGKLMARLYIEFDTVKQFNEALYDRSPRGNGSLKSSREVDVPVELQDDEGEDADSEPAGAAAGQEDGDKKATRRQEAQRIELEDMLEVLCKASELRECRLRLGDKSFLNESNKSSSAVRFRINNGMKGGREVREDWHKPFVLIQVLLANHSSAGGGGGKESGIDEPSLRNDAFHLWSCLPRVAKFLVDYSIHLGEFDAIRHALTLQRCLDQRMWFDADLLTKQLDGIGDATAAALARGGIRTINDVLAADGRRIEVLCGKHAPFGSEVRSKAAAIPQLSCYVDCQRTATGFSKPVVVLEPAARPSSTGAAEMSWSGVHPLFFTLLVGASSGRLLLYRRFRVNAATLSSGSPIRVELPSLQKQYEPADGAIEVHLVLDRFLGLDRFVKHEWMGVERPAGPGTAMKGHVNMSAEGGGGRGDRPALRQTKLPVNSSEAAAAPRRPHQPQQKVERSTAPVPSVNSAVDDTAVDLHELLTPPQQPVSDRDMAEQKQHMSLDELLDDGACVYLPRRKQQPAPTDVRRKPPPPPDEAPAAAAIPSPKEASRLATSATTDDRLPQAAIKPPTNALVTTAYLEQQPAAFDELLAAKRRALLTVVAPPPPSNQQQGLKKQEDDGALMRAEEGVKKGPPGGAKRSRSDSPSYSNGGAETAPSSFAAGAPIDIIASDQLRSSSGGDRKVAAHSSTSSSSSPSWRMSKQCINFFEKAPGQRRSNIKLPNSPVAVPPEQQPYGTGMLHGVPPPAAAAVAAAAASASFPHGFGASYGFPPARGCYPYDPAVAEQHPFQMPCPPQTHHGGAFMMQYPPSAHSSNNNDKGPQSHFFHHHQHHHHAHFLQPQQTPASKYSFHFVNAGKASDREDGSNMRGGRRGRAPAATSSSSADTTSGALNGLRRFVAQQAQKVDPLTFISKSRPEEESITKVIHQQQHQQQQQQPAAFAFSTNEDISDQQQPPAAAFGHEQQKETEAKGSAADTFGGGDMQQATYGSRDPTNCGMAASPWQSYSYDPAPAGFQALPPASYYPASGAGSWGSPFHLHHSQHHQLQEVRYSPHARHQQVSAPQYFVNQHYQHQHFHQQQQQQLWSAPPSTSHVSHFPHHQTTHNYVHASYPPLLQQQQTHSVRATPAHPSRGRGAQPRQVTAPWW